MKQSLKFSLRVAVALMFACAGLTAEPVQPSSARLQTLAAELESGNTSALATFWRSVEEEQTPLAEPLQDRPDDLLYTFLWRSTDDRVAASVRLTRTWPAPGRENPASLTHLPNSDVWYVSDVLPRAARFFYALEAPDPVTRTDGTDDGSDDPLNRRVLVAGSVDHPVNYPFVEGPNAPRSPYLQARADVARGTVHEHEVASAILGNRRRISVYTPPGFAASQRRLPLLLVFDGDAFQGRIPTPTILDNLIDEAKIPAIIAVFLFTPTGVQRNVELTPSDPFQHFLSEELLPFVQARYPISDDPARRVIAGSSLGGLIAAYTSLRQPRSFGNFISLSGSFWWGAAGDPSGQLTERSAWVVQEFAKGRKGAGSKVYLDVGTWEGPGQVMTNRMLHAILLGKGYDVTYREFVGGHAPFNWAPAFPEALIATFGRARH